MTLTSNMRAEFLAVAKTLGVGRSVRNEIARTISAEKVEQSLQGDFHVRLQIEGDTLEMGITQGEIVISRVETQADPHGRPRQVTRLVRTPHRSLRELLEYYALLR